MSLIVAARYPTFAQAENAARALFDLGLREEDVNIFFVNPPGQHATFPIGGDVYADAGAAGGSKTAAAGAAIGAVAGALLGTLVLVAFTLPNWLIVFPTGIGAYIGGLVGALSGMKTAARGQQSGQPTGVREAGVLVAVHATREQETAIAACLRRTGGTDIERAAGRWRNGKWADFDPRESPTLIASKM